MKIAVTSTGSTLDDQVDPRFGRCAYFLIVETDTMDTEALENSNIALGGGAGIQSAQLMSERDIKFVLTGNCGPNAFRTLESAGIQVIVGISGITVRQAVKQFKSGALSAVSDPNVDSHFGVGTGGTSSAMDSTQPPARQTGAAAGMASGRSRGMGGGGGMGRGMGRGMGNIIPPPEMTSEQELEFLKAQAQVLEEQLKTINTQISQIEKHTELPLLIAVVDLEKCNACGICQTVCPTRAITVNKTAQIELAQCNGCGLCVAECPQDAISLHKAK